MAFVGARGEIGRPAHLLALVLAVVVPVYWAQPLPIVPVVGTAAALTGALLLPAAIGSVDHMRLGVVDGDVLARTVSDRHAPGSFGEGIGRSGQRSLASPIDAKARRGAGRRLRLGSAHRLLGGATPCSAADRSVRRCRTGTPRSFDRDRARS